MFPQPIVLGYHGCSRALARQVVSGEIPLRQSSNEYDWLGHGIYFWAADPARAFLAPGEQTRLGKPRVGQPELAVPA